MEDAESRGISMCIEYFLGLPGKATNTFALQRGLSLSLSGCLNLFLALCFSTLLMPSSISLWHSLSHRELFLNISLDLRIGPSSSHQIISLSVSRVSFN